MELGTAERFPLPRMLVSETNQDRDCGTYKPAKGKGRKAVWVGPAVLRTSDQEVRSYCLMFYKMMGVKHHRGQSWRGERSQGSRPSVLPSRGAGKLQTFYFPFPLKTSVWAFLTEK